MAEVAEAAGMSRSTAYRRFPTKEDVVLEVPLSWLAAFDQAADDLPTETTAAAALAAASLAVAARIDEDHATVRTAYAILGQSPTLQQSGAAMAAWLERLHALVTKYADVEAETAAMIAGAYMGAIDAMMQHWAVTGGTDSVTSATTRLLERALLDSVEHPESQSSGPNPQPRRHLASDPRSVPNGPDDLWRPQRPRLLPRLHASQPQRSSRVRLRQLP